MKKMREQKGKLNKGFSLVELIVVIAIMAVLVGIIGTQFVKYVGQSKKSVDATNVETLQQTANVVLADNEIGDVKAGTYIINGDGTLKEDNVGGKFEDLLVAALGNDASGKPKYPKASDGTTPFIITVTDSGDGGFSASVTLGTTASASPTATAD